ncbi:hypothetical protein FHX78_1328 [Streptomyces capillispiralis]|uniref:Uncharacterized protein n=1 Tax=Streptomyces capillispiralis TaxID=68182 RepID=A0A561SGC3_9ACTN|nr:hypothetical protein FHX78_1328 [Streptomyces capillispiralis]
MITSLTDAEREALPQKNREQNQRSEANRR